MHIYNSSTQEVDIAGSGIEDQPDLNMKFETSLSYMRPCLKATTNMQTQEGKSSKVSTIKPSPLCLQRHHSHASEIVSSRKLRCKCLGHFRNFHIVSAGNRQLRRKME